MIVLYVFGWVLIAFPFVFMSWLGLHWHKRCETLSGWTLFRGLGFGPLACLLTFGGWVVITLLLAPRGDPPIGVGVAIILGGPALFISSVCAVVMGYYEWSDFG